MKKFAFMLIISLFLFQSTFFQPVHAENKNNVKTFMDQFFKKEMKKYDSPSAEVVLVENGSVVFSKGYGYANIEEKIPMSPDTSIVRIASVTKWLTAAALMNLVEEGKVGLHEDIRTYLNDLPIPNKYDTPITPFHLLTHTEGFEEDSIGIKTKDAHQLQSLQAFLKKRTFHQAAKPGETITYGNTASLLQGAIIEKVSGMTYEEYVKENILKPLQMNNSFFDQPIPKEYQRDTAKEYVKENDTFTAITDIYSHLAPAGELKSTADDMAQFMIMLLNEGKSESGKSVLQPDTVNQMVSQAFTSTKGLPGMTLGAFEHYENGEYGVFRNGQSEVFQSKMFLLPKRETGIFVTSSSEELANDLISEYLDSFYPKDVKPKTITDDLSKFEGMYNYIQASSHTLTKFQTFATPLVVKANGNKSITIKPLFMDPFGGFDKEVTLYEVDHRLFQGVDHEMYVSFDVNDAGKVTRLHSGSGYHSTFVKLSWHENIILQLCLLLFFPLYYLVTMIVSAIQLWRKRHSDRTITWQLFFSSLSHVSFLILVLPAIAFVGMWAGVPQYVQGTTTFMTLVLTIPFISLALLVMFIVRLRKGWSHFRKLTKFHYGLYTVITIFYFIFLYNWKWLGYWY